MVFLKYSIKIPFFTTKTSQSAEPKKEQRNMTKSKYKKGGINITAILCAVIIAVAGVLVTLIGVGSSWFTNADVRTWFNSWGRAPETYEIAVLPQEAGCMVLSSTKAKGAPVFNGAYSNEQKTCTLTATLTPADAYYSSVTWTATDADGNASTHVRLTQDENNPLTVQVELLGELFFTEQITVEIVSVNTLTASCSVDYLAFPDSVNVSPDPYTEYLKCGATYSLNYDFNYGTTAGTVTSDIECVMTDWQLYLTNETLEAISSELGVSIGWDYAWEGSEETITLGATPWNMFCGSEIDKDDFNRAFFKVCNGRNDIAELSVNCDFIYNGKTYAHLSGYRTIGIDSASYAIGLDGVSIDDIFIAG